MPSSHSSISSSTHSANNGAASVHSDIAATAAPPTHRSSARQSLPAGMESLSGRRSLRDGSAGSGIGNISRYESLQNGMAAQVASSSVSSGTWRERIQAGTVGSGSTPAEPQRPGSEKQSSADSGIAIGIGIGVMSRSESPQYGMAAQSAKSSVTPGAWRESMRADNAGSGSGSGSGRIPPPDVLQLDVPSSRRYFAYSGVFSACGPLQGMRSWQISAIKEKHNISHMTDEEAAMYLDRMEAEQLETHQESKPKFAAGARDADRD